MIYLLFFFSGISGLVYQVIWVREFGVVFGNNVYSAATVAAIFMCGLGVGSFAVGRWADRHYARDPSAPLRTYGWFELGIAGLGLAIALAIPQLEAFSAAFSHYELGVEGWFELSAGSHAVRYAIAIVLLAPITLLMGATLTLLIRHCVAQDVGDAGWRVGVLYGVNTAGAALGALASDMLLVPSLGILRTQGVAIGLNVLAGLGALALARTRSRGHVSASDSPDAAVEPSRDAGATRLVTLTACALFLAGFAAMGMEILWFRYLVSNLGGLRSVFSLLLTVILIGIVFGSLLGGWLHRRYGHPVRLYLIAQTLFAVLALGTLAASGSDVMVLIPPASLAGRAEPSTWLALLFDSAINLNHIGAVVGVPAVLMGCSFPLSNAHVQRLEGSVGRRAGALYLANTLGNVSGSLVTGFVLLPILGLAQSAGWLVVLTAIGLVPMVLSSHEVATRGTTRTFGLLGVCLAAAISAVVVWTISLPPHHLVRPAGQLDASDPRRLVAVSEGINESIVVLDDPSVGRVLYTNGHPMSATAIEAQRYMRLFSHLPLLNADRPRDVLVICLGVGSTLHAASLHPSVERLEVVDLSRNVVSQIHHFADSNRDVLDDERVSVFINDGRQHLRMQPEASYDLITLEPPPISFAGVSALYAREFYELARSRLVEGGAMTQWLPAYQVPHDTTLSIVRAFVDVFPNAVLLSGFKRELILMGTKGGETSLDLERVAARIEQEPRVRRDLERVLVGGAGDLAATFAAGPETLRSATHAAPAVTDDRPLMEYSVRTTFIDHHLPSTIFDASELPAFCPGCFEASSAAETTDLAALMEILQSYYATDLFLRHTNFGKPPDHTGDARELADQLRRSPCVLEQVRANDYLSMLFEEPLAEVGRGRPPVACTR